MLGIGGKFAGAKGMVAVPNISGLSRSAAQAAITNAGLKFLEAVSPVDTTNSSLDGQVSSQSFAAGTLIDYETTVSYSYYRYVAPPPSGPSLVSTQRLTNTVSGSDCYCSGYTRICTPYVVTEVSYRYNYSDGTSTTVRAPSEDVKVSDTNDKVYEYDSAACGYVAPACTPVYSAGSPWYGECVNGYQIVATRYTDVACGTGSYVESYYESCCVSTAIFVSSWKGSCINCSRQTAVRYRDSCTGEEWVESGSESCCSGGGGGTLVAV